MQVLVLLFGGLIAVLGLAILVRPVPFLALMKRYAHSLSLHWLAVVVRLILGAALLGYADQSGFPLTLKVLGWLSIAAAVILAIIPHRRFGDFVTWMLGRFSSHLRWGGAAAILFGAFLFHAAS